MDWHTHYLPPERTEWQGRNDIPHDACVFQSITLLDLRQLTSSQHPLAFAFLGFRSDEGVKRNQGRAGAAEGPTVIRQMLSGMPLHKKEIACYDAGDMICIDDKLEAAQEALAEAVALLLKHQYIPILLGGGHEIAWGHYQGIITSYPNTPIGIVNFDAHFDMREAAQDESTSGTPFLQIAKACEKAKRLFDYHCIGIQPASNISSLFNTAKKYDVKFLLAEELYAHPKAFSFLKGIRSQHLYVSLCLDVFASPYAPGVSAPQPLGLTPWQVIPILRTIAKSGKGVSYDIAELAPRLDSHHRTAKLAANLIYEIMHHHTREEK